MMMTDSVLTEVRDRVMVITINRPLAKNAIDKETAEAISAAIDELESRDDGAAAVLTGAGGTFCAGMDLKAFLNGESPSIPGRGLAGITERPPTKPLIAAVEGWALAGGCELALAADAGWSRSWQPPELPASAAASPDTTARDRKSTRLNSSHTIQSRMPSSA